MAVRPWNPGGEHVLADDANRRIDVDQPVEFRAAVRRGERRVPHRVAGGQRHRHDLAVVEAADRHFLGDDRASPCRAGSGAAPAARPTTAPCRCAHRSRADGRRPSACTTTFSLIAGADSSSELTCVRHSSLAASRLRARSPRPCWCPPPPCRSPRPGPADSGIFELLHPDLAAGLELTRPALRPCGRPRTPCRCRSPGPSPKRSLICFLPPPTPSPHSFLTGSVCGKLRPALAGGSTSLSLLQPAAISSAARLKGSNKRIRVWPCSKCRAARCWRAAAVGGAPRSCDLQVRAARAPMLPRSPSPSAALYSAHGLRSVLLGVVSIAAHLVVSRGEGACGSDRPAS